jgi:hypothetical protein
LCFDFCFDFQLGLLLIFLSHPEHGEGKPHHLHFSTGFSAGNSPFAVELTISPMVSAQPYAK